MDPWERLKRRVASRLLNEPDVVYFENAIDNKVAQLTYKDREIVIERRGGGYILFLRRLKEYIYTQDYYLEGDIERAIEKAKHNIMDDLLWR